MKTRTRSTLLLFVLPLVGACHQRTRDVFRTEVTFDLVPIALAVDPIDPGRVYLGATRGLFRSLDGARTWEPLPGAPPLRRIEGSALGPRRLWGLAGVDSATTIHRSDDDGASWSDLTPGLPAAPTGLAVDPRDGERAWVTTGTLLHVRAGAVWTPVFASVAAIESLTVDGAGALFAGLGGALHRSGDGGRTWTPSGQGLPGELARALAFDPLVRGTAYALGRDRVYRSGDGGQSWSPWGDPLPAASAPLAVALHRAGWDLLVRERAGGVLRMPVGGGGWTAAPLPFVSALASDPASPGVAYAAGPEGVLRTVDGGATWAPTDFGLPRRTEEVWQDEELKNDIFDEWH